MRFAVCVKQAIDESELKFDTEKNAIVKGSQTKISTFDKNAVEEALRLRSASGGEVIVFSFGDLESKKAIKEALAMGCDKGVYVKGDTLLTSSLQTSYYLAEAIKKYWPFEIVFFAEGSSDIYTSLVPGQVSAFLNIPFIPFVKKIELKENRINTLQAMDEKTIVSSSQLPVAVSVVSEINQPRYPTLIQIMQAAKKQIDEINPSSMQDIKSEYKIEEIKAINVERKKIIFEGEPKDVARALYEALIKEGLIKK